MSIPEVATSAVVLGPANKELVVVAEEAVVGVVLGVLGAFAFVGQIVGEIEVQLAGWYGIVVVIVREDIVTGSVPVLVVVGALEGYCCNRKMRWGLRMVLQRVLKVHSLMQVVKGSLEVPAKEELGVEASSQVHSWVAVNHMVRPGVGVVVAEERTGDSYHSARD